MLQDIIRLVIVVHVAANKREERGRITGDEHFKGTLIACHCLCNEDTIGYLLGRHRRCWPHIRVAHAHAFVPPALLLTRPYAWSASHNSTWIIYSNCFSECESNGTKTDSKR